MGRRTRKVEENIVKEIVRCMMESEYENMTSEYIAKKIKSNWLTTKSRLEKLEKEGIVKSIVVMDKTVGYTLNKYTVDLIKEVTKNGRK